MEPIISFHPGRRNSFKEMPYSVAYFLAPSWNPLAKELKFLKKDDVSSSDIDWIVLHQANARIIEATAKKLKMDLSKFPMSLQDTGNTSSASIPSLMNLMKKDGRLVKGQKIVIASFGAGLTWDAAYFEY